MTLVVNPNLGSPPGSVSLIGFEIRSNVPWSIIPGKFEVDYLDIRFRLVALHEMIEVRRHLGKQSALELASIAAHQPGGRAIDEEDSVLAVERDHARGHAR